MEAEYPVVHGALPYGLFDRLDREIVGGLSGWEPAAGHVAGVLWSPFRWSAE